MIYDEFYKYINFLWKFHSFCLTNNFFLSFCHNLTLGKKSTDRCYFFRTECFKSFLIFWYFLVLHFVIESLKRSMLLLMKYNFYKCSYLSRLCGITFSRCLQPHIMPNPIYNWFYAYLPVIKFNSWISHNKRWNLGINKFKSEKQSSLELPLILNLKQILCHNLLIRNDL